MKNVDLQTAETAVALTRKEKLLRWADLIRAQPEPVVIFHKVEYWPPMLLEMTMAQHQTSGYRYTGASAFSIAASDPVFKAAGLRSDSVAASMAFFELNQSELHSFSCDCGGHITNSDMADRITRLAFPSAPLAGMPSIQRLKSTAWWRTPSRAG